MRQKHPAFLHLPCFIGLDARSFVALRDAQEAGASSFQQLSTSRPPVGALGLGLKTRKSWSLALSLGGKPVTARKGTERERPASVRKSGCTLGPPFSFVEYLEIAPMQVGEAEQALRLGGSRCNVPGSHVKPVLSHQACHVMPVC